MQVLAGALTAMPTAKSMFITPINSVSPRVASVHITNKSPTIKTTCSRRDSTRGHLGKDRHDQVV